MKIKSFRQTWTGQTKIHLHFLSSCRSQKSRSFSRVRNTRIKCNALQPAWSNSLHIILRPRLPPPLGSVPPTPNIDITRTRGKYGNGNDWVPSIVKPWSKSESKPLSQHTPKSNKSHPKKGKKRIWTLGYTIFTWVVTHPPPP